MAKNAGNQITSCTIFWENTEDGFSVATKVLQTEIHVRLYQNGNLLSGRIWPVSGQQKEELYQILYRCLEDRDGDGYTVGASDSPRWQMKICGQRSCLRTLCGTVEPPHGAEMKKILAGIIGEENCRLF